MCRGILQLGLMVSLFVTPEANSLSKSPGCLFLFSFPPCCTPRDAGCKPSTHPTPSFRTRIFFRSGPAIWVMFTVGYHTLQYCVVLYPRLCEYTARTPNWGE